MNFFLKPYKVIFVFLFTFLAYELKSEIKCEPNKIVFIDRSTNKISNRKLRFKGFTKFNINHSFYKKTQKIFPFFNCTKNNDYIFYSSLYPFIDELNQGAQFLVSNNKKFALLYSYSCQKPTAAAEIPWNCNTHAVLVDENGYYLTEATGDFIKAEIHQTKPYFIMIRSSCGDSAVYAELFNKHGAKLCTISDHKNSNWTKKNSISCIYQNNKKRINLN